MDKDLIGRKVEYKSMHKHNKSNPTILNLAMSLIDVSNNYIDGTISEGTFITNVNTLNYSLHEGTT